ncbi:Methyltransferase small domain-containing protein [Cryobacterium flavum]|uniref:Methyltransferase small domain-containing protein n=1 Tax=Cryobacterium flavum TaxID=1424659 RepID=A0A5E9FUP1_9MICO|nr:Methyltransferase small domain-containing protein [Cryobacterium flavum]
MTARIELNRTVTPATLVPRLRTDLAAAHFSVPGLTGLWGIEADAALRRNQRVPAQRALATLAVKLSRNEPAATLARLFLLGDAVPRADLDAALPTLGAGGAERLGLVAAVDTLLRPLVDLRPYSFIDAHGAGSWWIVSDLGELALGHPLGESHVLGIGGASRTLSGLMMPRAVERALDIGTGCGIQAMHASRHAEHVVATDISVRALELAALNAELNQIDNIEFRFGSLFEPVAGERFDHIISNPPFVITPRTEGVPSYEYRDGGMVGDALVEAVVRGAANHLTPGGVVQLLGNWEYYGETDAFERLERWLTPGALDAWIIEREVQTPGEYAETWIRDGGTRPGPDFDRLYKAWLNDFEARGVGRVGFGYLLLRLPETASTRGTAPGLRRLERLPDALGHNPAGLGAHLAECLAAHDWQAATDDARLLRTNLTVASDVTEERHYWPGQQDPTLMTLHQGSGFGRSLPLDTALAGLVGACDGELAVGAIIGALAQLLDADEPALTAELLPKVRALLVDGFLK